MACAGVVICSNRCFHVHADPDSALVIASTAALVFDLLLAPEKIRITEEATNGRGSGQRKGSGGVCQVLQTVGSLSLAHAVSHRGRKGLVLALRARQCQSWKLRLLLTLGERMGRGRRARRGVGHESSLTLTALGFGLCKAFRRETPSRQTLSREDRYGYLERTAAKEEVVDHCDGPFQSDADSKKHYNIDAPRSAGLRSMFARSIWARSPLHFACDARAVCASEDYNSIALDSGFDHFDADSGVGVSWENGPSLVLEKELERDRKALVSPSVLRNESQNSERVLEIDFFVDHYVYFTVHRCCRVPRRRFR